MCVCVSVRATCVKDHWQAPHVIEYVCVEGARHFLSPQKFTLPAPTSHNQLSFTV